MNKLLVKNINIIQWRGLHNLKLDFNENYNEICGKNGSGKTSILDLIKYMLFDTKNSNKHSRNISSFDSLPNVDIDLLFNNEVIHLHTQKDKWFIDGVHFNTKIDYQKSLAQRLGLDDINDIKSNVFPNLLEDIFLTDKQDSKEGRDELMSILEPKLSNESRRLINNGGLKSLFDEIYSFEEQIKQKNKMIKEKNEVIRSFKEHNKEILDWDTDNLNNIDKEIIENNEKISYYENVENKIANLRSEKIKLENNLDSKKELNKPQNKLKLTAFQILLIVLTFGIYFLVLKFKFRNENQISEYNSSVQSKQIELEINKIQNEINGLMHDKNYENVDIELLRNKKRDLDTATANHSSYLAKKAIFKKYNIELNELEKELSNLSNELESKRQIKTKISKELDQMLSNEFSNFEIELFDSKGNEKIQIKQNNIDLKFLNHANKWNIIFEINDFLKSKTITSFTVIDGTESFNKISRNNNVQVICSKVTTDEKLILNGQHIN